MDSLDAVNWLLEFVSIPLRVRELRECVPSLFIALFEGIFHERIKGIDRAPSAAASLQSRSQNVSKLIGVLENCLREKDALSHISPAGIVQGNERDVRNLVQVFWGIAATLHPHAFALDELEASASPTEEDEDEESKDEAWGGEDGLGGEEYEDLSSIKPPFWAEEEENDVGTSPSASEASDDSFHRPQSPDLKQPPRRRSPVKIYRSGFSHGRMTLRNDIEEYAKEMGPDRFDAKGPVYPDIHHQHQQHPATSKSAATFPKSPKHIRFNKKANAFIKRDPYPLATDSSYLQTLKIQQADALRCKRKATSSISSRTSQTPLKQVTNYIQAFTTEFARSTRQPDSKASPRRSPSPQSNPRQPHISLQDDLGLRPSSKEAHDEEDELERSRALRNFRAWERAVKTELAVEEVPKGVEEKVWKENVRDWRRAVDYRLYERQVRKHKVVKELEEDDAKSRMMRAKAAMQKSKPLPTRPESIVKSRVSNQRRRVIRMENRVKDAEKDVESVLRKRRMEEEKLVKDLYAEYLAKQREAIRHNSRLLRDELREKNAKERQKREARDHYEREQLRMLEEEMRAVEREEELVMKAQAEEMRKVLREQKHAARQNISLIKRKLEIDERDFDLRRITAARLKKDLGFKVLPKRK
ncbi:hypothetical protein HDU67_007244 [Dinochytrium kinnereticum]|nr:hypothetical protein HDU67_007244 [Dinochytrium kinnereticum]